jgi:hypothetical protein
LFFHFIPFRLLFFESKRHDSAARNHAQPCETKTKYVVGWLTLSDGCIQHQAISSSAIGGAQCLLLLMTVSFGLIELLTGVLSEITSGKDVTIIP